MSGGVLAGRVVLVTGAAGGLGSVAAKASARAGATVVLLGRTLRKLEQLYDEIVAEGSPQPAIYPLDLAGASEKDYAELAATLERELGSLHGLVHAAAELGYLGPLSDLDGGRWQRLLHVNLTAPFLLTRAVLSLMAGTGQGSVVFVGDSAVGQGKAYWGAYGVAKIALEGYARILVAENESRGIKVHFFTPGPMRTAIRHQAYTGENRDGLPGPGIHAEALVRLLIGLELLPTSS